MIRALYLLAVGYTVVAVQTAQAAMFVALNKYESSDGPSQSTVPFNVGQQTVQIFIAGSQLTGTVGQNITSLGFRINSAATPSDVDARTFSDYEITLAPFAQSFGSTSTTFANNMGPGASLVRDGALTLGPAGTVTGPSYGSAVNAFYSIPFNQGSYAYTGGDLVVQIRHTGGAEGSYSMDATPSSDPDYGNSAGRLIYSISANSFSATTASFAVSAPVLQFTAVPEPSEWAAVACAALLAFAGWSRSRHRSNAVGAL